MPFLGTGVGSSTALCADRSEAADKLMRRRTEYCFWGNVVGCSRPLFSFKLLSSFVTLSEVFDRFVYHGDKGWGKVEGRGVALRRVECYVQFRIIAY